MSTPIPTLPAQPAAACLAPLVFAALTLAVTPARAANDFSIGVGVGAASGRVDCLASFPCDRKGTSASVSAAYRFSESIDVRAQYFAAGSFEGADTTPRGTGFGGSFKVTGIGLTGGYHWNFAPAWSLAGRAGVASVRTRFEYADPFSGIASAGKTTLQPLLGVGIAYAITPTIRLGIDYDVTRFKVHTTRGPLQMLGVAAQFSF